ncbi:hypothetical protein GFN85_23285 [Salmonella enterica]|nr:hypothetical protein [Salmonella enterica]EEN9709486.1 GNAT family N-acetyltransferase [Salmonella enterica]
MFKLIKSFFSSPRHKSSPYTPHRIKQININELYFKISVGETIMTIRAYFHYIELGHAYIILENSEKAKLADIILLENYIGMGIGSKLLEKVINECSARGIKSIYGTMVGEKDKLIKFYGKFGFEIHEDNIELLIQRPITTT